MNTILCATRGGEQSLHTQEAAIRLAKDQSRSLIFFIAFDMEFMAEADFALRDDVVAQEMDKMCEFLMMLAVERAGQQGVEASSVVRRGDFREELRDAIQQEHITTVVLGRPADDPHHTELAVLQAFAMQLQQETRVEVLILP